MQPAPKIDLKTEIVPLEVRRRSKKTKPKLKFRFRLRSALLLLVAAYVVFIFLGGHLQIKETDEKIAELQKEKIKLEQERQSLLNKKQMLNSPAYIERRAREALGLIKPGETVLMPAQPGEVMPLVVEGREDIGD